MQKKMLALLLCGCLLLSGCQALLNREYADISDHDAAPTAEDDPSVLRADSYQELVNALMYLVTGASVTGTIRLYVQGDEAESFLEDACLEVVQEDPLGAYAVEYIKYEVTSLVTYHEVEVQITYRRSREQIASIASATGASAIRSELEQALAEGAKELVLRISYFDRDEAYIRRLFLEAWRAGPETAADLPDISVSIYPDSGTQRIVEVLLDWHLEDEILQQRQEQLGETVAAMAGELEEDGGDTVLQAAFSVLRRGGFREDGGSTTWDALEGGGADSLGLAMAMSALCGELDIDCRIVDGQTAGQTRCWNLVQTDQGWRHLDLCALEVPEEPSGGDGSTGTESEPGREGPEHQTPEEPGPYFRTDRQMAEAGYQWDAGNLPESRSEEEEQQQTENPGTEPAGPEEEVQP